MMSEQFYNILTDIGKAQIANSNVLGNKINFVKFKVGDGGGKYYNPTPEQQDLVNTVWEGAINSIFIDENNNNWIVVQTIIPTNVGGFTIREAAVFDDDNNMIAVGKYPETYKPIFSEGSAKDLIIKIIFEVSNAENITLKVDPTVTLATKNDIDVLETKMLGLLEKHSLNMNHIYYCGQSEGENNIYQVNPGSAPKLQEGLAISLKAHRDSTAECKCVYKNSSQISILKSNGKAMKNFKKGSIYTMRYNGANFILQGEGGSGNATADDILARKTASTDAGDIVGTMIDHEPCTNAVNISGYNPMYVRIPKGAYINSSGSGFPEISIPRDKLINNLGITADIIKKGENICGVNGVLDTNYGDEGFAIEYIKCFKTAYVSYSGGYSPNIDENISSRVVKVNDSEVYIDLDYQPYSINLCFPYSMADSDSRQNRYNDIEVELDTYTKLYLNKTVQCSRDARRYSKDYSSDGGGTHGPYTVYNCTANITLTKINNKYRLQIISNTTWTSERDYKKDKNIIIKEGDTFNGFGAIRIHRVANTIIGI